MNRRDEQGQVTLLIVGFTAIVLVLLAVVTDASKAYLVRRDLSQLADGAALVGTRGVSGSIRTDGALGTIELSQDAAETEVARYLSAVGDGGYRDLTATVIVTGPEVTVDLRAIIELPLGIPGADKTVTVRADGSSILATR